MCLPITKTVYSKTARDTLGLSYRNSYKYWEYTLQVYTIDIYCSAYSINICRILPLFSCQVFLRLPTCLGEGLV